MMLSLPSALAAAISASIPPQSVTDVAVFALQLEDVVVVPPQAATMTNATTARPSRRIRLLNFMFLPLTELPHQADGQYAEEILLPTCLRCKDGEWRTGAFWL